MNKQSMTYAESCLGVSRKQAERRKHSAIKTEWWEAKRWSVVVPLLMTALDFIVVKLIIDKACFQQEFFSYLLAFGLSLALNFIPSQFVKKVFYAKYNLRTDAKFWAIVLFVAFALLYGAMLYVRFCNYDMFLPDSGASGVIDTLDASASAEAPAGAYDVRKAIAMTLLTSISPLVTSLICAGISYATSDPMDAMIRERQTRRAELLTEYHRIEVALVSYDRQEQELIELDNGRYLAARQAIHERCAALQAKALLALEEHIGRADATSKISADAIQKSLEADRPLPNQPEQATTINVTPTPLLECGNPEAPASPSEPQLSA